MRYPWDAVQPFRVELALNSPTLAPAWQDVSSSVKGSGVRIQAGSGEWRESTPASTCTVAFDNSSAFLSTVALYRKPLRVSYRQPGVPGNFLTAEDASFEGGTVGGWTATGGTSLANSATHPSHGTKGLLVTWATAATNTAYANTVVNGLTIGRIYTLSARVWVAPGSPAVAVFETQGIRNLGTPSSITGAFTTVSRTFLAGATSLFVGVVNAGATTAGQQVWVDSVMVDEGSTVGTFTTSPPPISYRFTGRIATPRLDFPSLGRSIVSITATDELAWQGPMFRKFIDVPGQEILSRSPVSLFRLVEADLSDQVSQGVPASFAGSGAYPVAASTATTAASTAIGTSFSGGRYITGALSSPIDPYFPTGVTLTATVRTTSSTVSTIASLRDQYNDKVTLSLDATGKVVASTTNPWFPVYQMTATSASAINDGQPHVVSARWTNTGTLSLSVDSAAIVSTTNAAATGHQGASSTVTIGGGPTGTTFTGTIANVAAFREPLSDAILLEIAQAALSAFQGETAANRLARYNRWAGSPFSTIVAAGAVSQIGHFDTDDKGLTDAIAAVATVEDSLAYVRGDGALVLLARSGFYNAAPAFTIPGPGNGAANLLGDSLTYATDPSDVINDVSGTRPNGGTQHAINSTSAAEYGWRNTSVDGPFATDADLGSLLDWIINTRSTPKPKVDGLSMRLTQLSDAQTATFLGLALGSTVAWTGLPSQAPASTDAGVVLSVTETYSHTDVVWEAQVRPNPAADVWVIGDPVYGHIGTTHRIAH